MIESLNDDYDILKEIKFYSKCIVFIVILFLLLLLIILIILIVIYSKVSILNKFTYIPQ